MRPSTPLCRRRLLRRALALAGLGLVAGCGVLPSRAQPPKLARVGVLTNRGFGDSLPEGAAFRRGLNDLGWIPGESARIEYRFSSSPESRAEAIAELVSFAPHVLVAEGNALLLSLKAAAGTTPIVMANSRNPVAAGLVASLARPGGNVTGLANFGAPLTAKRLELIRQILPHATRVTIAWFANTEGDVEQGQVRDAAAALGMRAHFAPFRSGHELRDELATRPDALLLFDDLLPGGFSSMFRGWADEMRVPVVVGSGALVRDGSALLSYGPSVPEQFRRAAAYVDKILRGAHPADLPVEQPTTFESVINLKTAQALGLTIPDSLLLQATEIIQ